MEENNRTWLSTEAVWPLLEKHQNTVFHTAKGLEFTSVFLPDLNEGVIPGKNARTPSAIEEERRLLYVAITRARDFLYLYCTRERNRKPTRFLERVSLPH